MSDFIALVAAASGGLLVGVFFFASLWWTVLKGVTSRHPALWFTGSLLVRMGIALGAFYLIADGRWERLLACLAGLVAARLFVERWTRPASEARHAS